MPAPFSKFKRNFVLQRKVTNRLLGHTGEEQEEQRSLKKSLDSCLTGKRVCVCACVCNWPLT